MFTRNNKLLVKYHFAVLSTIWETEMKIWKRDYTLLKSMEFQVKRSEASYKMGEARKADKTDLLVITLKASFIYW